ncbi:MAG TPA: transporter substrate-binding domain-containing protein, partial [Candidatus Limousia pullorum]|nr:transporter substrate-binding domain-containing protein [Candidatus Limousia pullorum]
DEKVATNYINMKPGKYRILEADGKEITLSEEEYVIAFRKGDQALMEKIMETLKEMKEDGKLAEISTKWFEEDVTTI